MGTTTPAPPANSATGSAALSATASEFDSVAAELQGAIARVEATAADLLGALQGPAGAAAQAAFMRFGDASAKQIRLLQEIETNISQAGIQYQTDTDGQPDLTGGMGISMDLGRGPIDFSQGEAAVSEIQGAVATVQGLLDQGGQILQKLAPAWGGTGSDAYQQMRPRWDAAVADLNAALANLANTISQAWASMTTTDSQVSGMFQ